MINYFNVHRDTPQAHLTLFVGYARAVYNAGDYLLLCYATTAQTVAQAEQNAIEDIKRIVANNGGDVDNGEYMAEMSRAHNAISFYGVVGAVREKTLHTRFVQIPCAESEEATRIANEIAIRTFPPSEGYASHGLSIDHIGRVVHQLNV